MFYRLVLKEGPRLVNMAEVRTVVLKGKDLYLNFAPAPSAGLFEHSKPPQEWFIYNTKEAAAAVFEEIAQFVARKSDTSPPSAAPLA
jgi:hypothetical protein